MNEQTDGPSLSEPYEEIIELSNGAMSALPETSVLEAVDFRAASAASASALPLPLPPKCSYFTSSYPTHLFGSG